MRRNLAIWILVITFALHGLCQGRALTQKEACSKLSDAVVGIQAGPGPTFSFGTGFLVSSNGYVLTALHVVRDENGDYLSPINLLFSDGTKREARPQSTSPESVGRDFALLKIDNGQSRFPYLELGSLGDANVGGDATIIGFPFSASAEGSLFTQKLCLIASIAGKNSITVTVKGTKQTVAGNVPISIPIQVDVIYFRGPSIKGISGSPIISRDNGKVVGIVSAKLTGIGAALDQTRRQINETRSHGSVTMMGVDPLSSTNQIISVLDDQLANGLGAAVGIDSPAEALRNAQKRNRNR